ncbi:MAG: aldehyde dehydrogenase family protein [Candidatus Binatia bacterium]|nr:aldehyde dehydrogenase family protein [Candidatus Binatia bacterium]
MTATQLKAIPAPHSPVDDIPPIVERMRATFDSGKTRPLAWRRGQLKGVLRFGKEQAERLAEALHADLGKPAMEAYAADIAQASNEAKLALKNLAKWTKPEAVGRVPFLGRSVLMRDPLGVVLIIAPWNYPVGLLLSPLVGAIAAGNTTVLKPSEVTAHTSAVLAEMLPKYLDPDAVAVVEGGVEETTALLDQRFDHIMYTGNGQVGRIVMEKAAKTLTPVTLELGGKSPCIVDRTADLEITARRIAWGKFINSGQTCIAPDYVLVEESVRDELIATLEKTVKKFYGDDPQKTNDYARVVNERHHGRLTKLLEGQEIAFGGKTDVDDCYIEPTVLKNVSPDAEIMKQEIFGPILPVLSVQNIDEAISFVREREKPLALYIFTSDEATENKVLEETSSGGACVNGTVMHIGDSRLPFGGVGESGMGAYHGRSSFETFTHRKAVLKRGFRFDMKMMYPPYTKFLTNMVKKSV